MLERDADKLRLLFIAYVIFGAFTMLGGLAGLASSVVLHSIFESFSSLQVGPRSPDSQTPRVLVAVGTGLVLLFGYAQLRAGLMIRRRRARTYCLVIAAVTAMLGPLGLAVSIFTFFVLTTPSVSALFVGQPAEPVATASRPG